MIAVSMCFVSRCSRPSDAVVAETNGKEQDRDLPADTSQPLQDKPSKSGTVLVMSTCLNPFVSSFSFYFHLVPVYRVAWKTWKSQGICHWSGKLKM